MTKKGAVLALPRRSADHALLYQRIDLALRIAELTQHLVRMLAEGRRHAAQARLVARKADRGSDALVPVLAYHVAAVSGMVAGESLVDPLHRTGRQTGGEQAIAQGFGLML